MLLKRYYVKLWLWLCLGFFISFISLAKSNYIYSNEQLLANGNCSFCPTLLILGNSLSSPDSNYSNWTYHITKKMQDNWKYQNIRVVNLSKVGITAANVASNIQNITKAINPTWAIVELGGNDGLRGKNLQLIEKDLNTIINTLSKHGAYVLLLGTILPPNYNEYGKQYTKIFTNLAQSYKKDKIVFMPFLLKSIIDNQNLFFPDKIHPNPYGHKLIAEDIWQYVEKLINRLMIY